MIYKIRAIILHTIKHTDSSLIVYAYTDRFGKQTYIINCSHSRKSKNRITLFQPLFLLDIEAYNKQTANIQRIKEYRLSNPLLTIPFDIKKTSIAMFIAEVLYKIIREEEPNEKMFDFIYNSILIFDKIDMGAENFHLHFLANLSRYIGFYPSGIYDADGFFDIKSGHVSPVKPKHTLYFDMKNTNILKQMLNIQVSNLHLIELNRAQRNDFLKVMLDFYSYHFEKLSPVNSLKIFTELFNSSI
ncbi:MAG: DNA repair protein RecO [Prevotellaceae bacterium]|jgi:DNA repair protein RecO (recombination protein O)|nr:DNA repair protein RecO [Prevotellaceae bacterium]